MRGRGATVIAGAWMSILRGQRGGESCRRGSRVPGAAPRGEVGAAATSASDPPEVGRSLGLKGTRHDLRQEHDERSEKEALVEHMTPPLRPPPRRSWRTRQENRRGRSHQQRLLQSLTRTSLRNRLTNMNQSRWLKFSSRRTRLRRWRREEEEYVWCSLDATQFLASWFVFKNDPEERWDVAWRTGKENASTVEPRLDFVELRKRKGLKVHRCRGSCNERGNRLDSLLYFYYGDRDETRLQRMYVLTNCRSDPWNICS